MGKPVIVIGSGGHSKVLISILQMLSIPIIGITDINAVKNEKSIPGLRFLGDDHAILRYQACTINLINGLGSVKSTQKRRMIFEKFKMEGYSFFTIIHPSAIIGPGVEISEGVQIMAGAVIQPGSSIGDNTIINTGACADHDCLIGKHVHLAPGVTLSGGVEIGSGTHVGTGTNIIQNIKIGSNSLIGAGSLVLDDLPEGSLAYGNPARVVNI